MTVDEYQKLHLEAFEPTYLGKKPDLGRVVVGEEHPGEGFAIIRCGNTEAKIGYTALHSVMPLIIPDPKSLRLRDQNEFFDAMASITCEASLGRTGDA